MGRIWAWAAALSMMASVSQAAVQQLADPVEKNGMTIAPLYIQPILMDAGSMAGMDHSKHGQPPAAGDMAGMDHSKHGQPPAAAPAAAPVADPKNEEATRASFDMHLEVRVHAAAKNPHGFPEGSWIPYLAIRYEVGKYGTDWRGQGELMPMAANDGPHYGGNVKLNGPGRYFLKATFTPPTMALHMDKETGVTGWWQPFTQEWDFSFFGAGKKGGY